MIHKFAKPAGIAHRERLRRLFLPRLAPGYRIWSSRRLGLLLGISGSEGYRHMRQVLTEAGVVTETRGLGEARRVYVVSLPQWREAA
jgi:hypothetical protein